MKIKRRSLSFFHVDENEKPDLAQLLQGEVVFNMSTAISLLCPFSGERLLMSSRELQVVASLPPGWIERDSLDEEAFPQSILLDLIHRSILLCDAKEDVRSRELLRLEKSHTAIGWHPAASLYHGMTRWSGIKDAGVEHASGKEHQSDRLSRLASVSGALPTHFFSHPDAEVRIALPRTTLTGELGEVLQKRSTTRHFDTSARLPLHLLANALYTTFGAIGIDAMAPGMAALKRTSASGGALHPIEAYCLVLNVERLETGFYHYEGETHRLARLKSIETAEARGLAKDLLIGQEYFSDAAALVFHVARLDRHHWKYRRHPKAYKAILLDSGHLSQTFYLAATHLGLGAFYTAAINDTDVEKFLQLDGSTRMVVGANGIGIIDPSKSDLHFVPQPYSP